MAKEFEQKRNSILKEAAAQLREAGEHLKAASLAQREALQGSEPAVDPDSEVLKQALLAEIAGLDNELAALETKNQ